MVTKLDLDDDIFGQVVPLIFVLSDARGETANTVVMAAAAQFGDGSVDIDRRGIPSIDLLGPAVTVISTLTGEEPTREIGAIYKDESSAN